MRFGTRNVRFLHRSGSLTTAARGLARYKLISWVYRRLVGTKGARKDLGDRMSYIELASEGACT